MKYEEVRLDERRQFVLSDGQVHVAAKDFFGNQSEETVNIALLDPNHTRMVVPYRYWQAGLWLAVLGTGAIIFIEENKIQAGGYWYWLFGFTGISGIILFLLSYRRKAEFVVFRNDQGMALLTLAKPKGPAGEFDVFLSELVSQIRAKRIERETAGSMPL